jgi:hypothetical protein
MVLLQDIIEVRHRPVLGESALGFELRDGGRVRRVTVGVVLARRKRIFARGLSET